MMKAKILTVAVAVAVGSAGVAALPVSAHEGHGSCRTFQRPSRQMPSSSGPWGQIASHGAQLGLTGVLTTEAHTIEGLCEPRP